MSGAGGLIGGVVGAVIGFTFGNPQIGWMVGSSIGGMFGTKKQGGPDMTDLRPQSSEYGRPIPIVYGTMALGGNVIWAADLIKTGDGDGGGKGGGGTPTGPTYAANFAVLVCEAPGGTITLGRIWAGPEKRLIWDGSKLESGALKFYNGSEDQLPDPLIESFMGVGQVPAYRGYAYVVIEMFDVSAHDGNRIPFLTVEVGNLQHVVLGYVWPYRAWLDSGNVVLKHGPGLGGLLSASTTTHQVAAQVTFKIGQFSEKSLYDADRHVMVTYASLTAVWAQPATSGALAVTHSIDTTGRPADLSPFSGDCLYYGSKYLFSVYKTSSTNEFGIYVVNPDTWATEAILRFPGMDTGVKWMAAPTAGSWVYALSAATVWKLPLDGSAPINLGAMPLGGQFSTPIFGVDLATNWLYTIPAPVTYSNSINYAVYDGITNRKVLEDTESVAPAFIPNCFVSVPRSGAAAMYLCGATNIFTDGFLKIDSATGGSPTFWEGATRLVGIDGAPNIQAAIYDPARDVVMAFRNGYGWAVVAETPPGAPLEGNLPSDSWHLGTSTLAPTPVPLSYVVADLSARAGLSSGDIDVTHLTDQVDGYTIANQVSIKDAIAALMPVYYFDAVEDQGVLRFVKRGGSIAVEIPDDDLGAHGSDEDVVDLYETTRGMDEDLSRTLSVNYVLAATKYSPATKYARRLIGYSGDEARMELPMVFSDAKAQQVAAVNLHDQWVSRLSYKLALGRKYAHLMPTDVVGVQGYTLRLTKVTQKDSGVLEFEAVRDDSDTYVQAVIVEETPPPDETVNIPVPTVLELM